MSHPFLCTDTTNGRILEFDAAGQVVRQLHTGLNVFDLWALPEGEIVYCHYGDGPSGVRAVDGEGRVLRAYLSAQEIFGCQPLENGGFLAGELRQKRLVETDREGNVTRVIPFAYREENPHETLRAVRKLRDGCYLAVSPGLRQLLFFSPEGELYKTLPTRHDTFGAVTLPGGEIAYTCMEGLMVIDAFGREQWTFTDQDAPALGIRWLLGLELLPGGNIVCCNWLGHGHDGEGIPIFEVTRDKRVVWTLDCRDTVGNLGNFCLLDADLTGTYTAPMR